MWADGAMEKWEELKRPAWGLRHQALSGCVRTALTAEMRPEGVAAYCWWLLASALRFLAHGAKKTEKCGEREPRRVRQIAGAPWLAS
jgi:hypothetical protein